MKKKADYSENILRQPQPELQDEKRIIETNDQCDTACLNKQRLQHLSVNCLKYKNELHYHHHRIVVDSWHKLLYCEISKGGCSTVKAVWMDLNESKEKNLTRVKKPRTAKAAHQLRRDVGLSIKLSQTWPNGYDNHTKFIVVRHPMDRLVSAYYNVVNFKRGMADHTPEILKYYKVKKHIKILNEKSLSFEQFLSDITNHNGIYNDRHWNPISETCSICQVKYDYFLRLETIFDDFQPISSILGHPHFKLKTYGALNGNTQRKRNIAHDNSLNWSKYLPQYQKVSKMVLEKVLQRYQYDLNLFGYYFNSTTYIASCLISHDGKTPLC